MCSFKLAVNSLKWASSSISILRFVSITIQAAVIWLLGGREVLLVAIYRISSSRSRWCSNLHSPSPTPTSILERTSGNTEEKLGLISDKQKDTCYNSPHSFCTQHCNTQGSTTTISLHPAWDVLANDRGGPLPHPYQTIHSPPPAIQNKSNQRNSSQLPHHCYHWDLEINSQQQTTTQFFMFLPPSFLLHLKYLSIWSRGGRKPNKKTSKQTN